MTGLTWRWLDLHAAVIVMMTMDMVDIIIFLLKFAMFYISVVQIHLPVWKLWLLFAVSPIFNQGEKEGKYEDGNEVDTPYIIKECPVS